MDEAEAAGNHMARVLGRNRNAVPLYLDLYFAPERKAAAVAEILAFPRDNWWDPDNPALIDTYLLPFLLAAAGAHDEALQELRRRQQQGTDYYPARLISISPLARDFSCRPEVQAFFDDMGLPPSPAAPACNGM